LYELKGAAADAAGRALVNKVEGGPAKAKQV
jgi:hypothetical protein